MKRDYVFYYFLYTIEIFIFTLSSGDILVYINGMPVLGCTHQDVVNIFQNLSPDSLVDLEVCRGYPLPFDPDDPDTEIITTVAVSLPEETGYTVSIVCKVLGEIQYVFDFFFLIGNT